MQRAFIIRPFGKKKDQAGREINFDHVHNVLIDPALKAAGLGGGTTGEIIEAGNIREAMFGLILEAETMLLDRYDCGPDGLITYVWDRKVASPNPGYCFKKAGWSAIGRSADGRKTLLWKDAALAGRLAPARGVPCFFR